VIDNPSTTHKHRLHLYSENPSIKMISFAPASNSLVTCPVPNILPVAQRRVHVLNRLIQLRQRHMSAPLGYPPLTMRFLKLAESTSLSWTFRLWKNPMTAIQKNPSRASRMNSTSPSQKNPTRASQKNPTRESQSAWIPCNALRVAMLAHPPASSGSTAERSMKSHIGVQIALTPAAIAKIWHATGRVNTQASRMCNFIAPSRHATARSHVKTIVTATCEPDTLHLTNRTTANDDDDNRDPFHNRIHLA
jgi:hypothetical protein